MDNLKMLTAAPSVQMQDVPSDLLCLENTEETDPDIRNSADDLDKRLYFFFSTNFNENFFSSWGLYNCRQFKILLTADRDYYLLRLYYLLVILAENLAVEWNLEFCYFPFCDFQNLVPEIIEQKQGTICETISCNL